MITSDGSPGVTESTRRRDLISLELRPPARYLLWFKYARRLHSSGTTVAEG
jgi:hypothetical protein